MRTPRRRSRSHLAAIAAGSVALLLSGTLVAGAASPAPSPVPSPAAAASVAPVGSTAPSASPSTSPVASPSASPVAALAVTATTSSGTVEATGGTWEIHLPTLTGPQDPAVVTAVNDALAAGAAADLAAFQSGSTLPPTGFDGTDGFTWDFTVQLLTPELLSLKVLTSHYAAGAAHPTAAMEPWTFDLTTGTHLALADLFRPDAAYLPRLSRSARAQLHQMFKPRELNRGDIRRGTKPRPGPFAGWTMTATGLEITFAQYQVGPYAIGMPVVTIPWARLGDLLDPNGPAAGFIVTAVPVGSPTPSASPAPATSASPAA